MKIYFIIYGLICMQAAVLFPAGKKAEKVPIIQEIEDITVQIQSDTILENAFEYTYASFGMPDPFVPNTHPTHMPSMSVLITNILQRYPIDRIRVVGIWELQNGSKKSLMMTEKSEGVVVAVGDSVGVKGGIITKIDSDHVVVREFTLNSEGEQHFFNHKIWLGSRDQPSAEKSITIQPDSYPEEEVKKVTEPASTAMKNEGITKTSH